MTTAPQPATPREWAGLAVLMLPTLLLALDLTVLHLAVPQLSADLRPSSSQLLWILDIYGFMIAGFLITMGTLGDRIGRRRLLLVGGAAFAVASALAAFSTSAEMLIATRALLGVAGATLMPSTLSLIRNMFQVDRERTFAITLWITAFTVGGAIGPLVGGLLLEFFWWGSVFLLGVPVMLLLLIAGPLLLPEFRDEAAGRLDLGSALLCIITTLALIYGIKHLARDGFDVITLSALLTSAGIGTLFIRRQRRLADPMFDLTLFQRRTFSTAIVALLLTLMALSGAWLMVFQYLQGVRGLSPLAAGLVMLPTAVLQVGASLSVPALARRIPHRGLITTGLLVAALGFLCIGQVTADGSLLPLLVGMTVMSAGMMPMMVLGTDLVIGSVPPNKAGTASATSETAAELGLAMGIAVIGSIGAAVYRARMQGQLPAALSPDQAAVATDTLGGALSVITELSTATAGEVMLLARAAFSDAMHVNAWIGAGIVVATALLIVRLLRD